MTRRQHKSRTFLNTRCPKKQIVFEENTVFKIAKMLPNIFATLVKKCCQDLLKIAHSGNTEGK